MPLRCFASAAFHVFRVYCQTTQACSSISPPFLPRLMPAADDRRADQPANTVGPCHAIADGQPTGRPRDARLSHGTPKEPAEKLMLTTQSLMGLKQRPAIGRALSSRKAKALPKIHLPADGPWRCTTHARRRQRKRKLFGYASFVTSYFVGSRRLLHARHLLAAIILA